jgi:hypothetical protein
LLFTFVAGDASDLLEGTLVVPQPAPHADTGLPRWAYWAAGAVLLPLLLVPRARVLRRRSSRTPV